MIKRVNYGGIKTYLREVWFMGFDVEESNRWYYVTYFSIEGIEDGFSNLVHLFE